MGAKSYSTPLSGIGLLILRWAVGFVFFMHGAQKLFVKGLPSVANFLDQMGMTPPVFWAAVLTAGEIVVGFALVVGFGTRVAAIVLSVTMVVAIAGVLWAKGFFLPGYEFAMTLLAASAALAFTGPGRYAIDRWLGLEG
jgi:putative oxidoreductase